MPPIPTDPTRRRVPLAALLLTLPLALAGCGSGPLAPEDDTLDPDELIETLVDPVPTEKDPDA